MKYPMRTYGPRPTDKYYQTTETNNSISRTIPIVAAGSSPHLNSKTTRLKRIAYLSTNPSLSTVRRSPCVMESSTISSPDSLAHPMIRRHPVGRANSMWEALRQKYTNGKRSINKLDPSMVNISINILLRSKNVTFVYAF